MIFPNYRRARPAGGYTTNGGAVETGTAFSKIYRTAILARASRISEDAYKRADRC